MELSTLETEDAFDAFLADDELTDRVLRAIAERHGFDEAPHRYAEGSTLVVAFGPTVLKLFAPFDAELAEGEARALAALSGKLSVQTPELMHHGTFETAPYILMRRLPGEDLENVIGEVGPAARRALGRQVGEMLAELHAIDAPESHARPDWDEWVKDRRADLVERQRARGAGERLLAGIDPLLDAADLTSGPQAFLHTEIMRPHLKLSPNPWRVVGLFDFEPSMVGPVDYEFASVGVFFSQGDRGMLRATLEGYGLAPEALDEPLSVRLMAMMLLHRYCHLPFFMRRTGAQFETIDELRRHWFSF